MDRKIVIDTETTHLDHNIGRIIEIGCVELINDKPTGNEYQIYLNPEMEISEESIRITGITNDMVKDKPLFSYIAEEFIEFIGNSKLIAHNAKFDIAYLNKELKMAGYDVLSNIVIDTLEIARKKFKTNNSLDGLAKRFEINLNHRQKHGAIIDARILAGVYYYLNFQNIALSFDEQIEKNILINNQIMTVKYIITEEDEQLHRQFLQLHKITNW